MGYGIYDLIVRRKWNFFSILGLFSILLTGGLGLLGISPFWFAVKEAAIPLTFGLAVLGSVFTPYPLVRTFLYNDKMIDVATGGRRTGCPRSPHRPSTGCSRPPPTCWPARSS